MPRVIAAVAAGILLCVGAWQSTRAAELIIPIEDFSRYDEFGEVKISPDGEFLAITTGVFGRSRLLFFNIAQKKFESGVAARTNHEIFDYEWISPTRIVYFPGYRFPGYKSAFRTSDLIAIDRDGKRHAQIYGSGGDIRTDLAYARRRESSHATASIVSRLPDDDRNILISEQPWREGQRFWYVNRDAAPRLARLNVLSGDKRSQGAVPLASAQVLVDANHEVRFAFGRAENGRFAAIWKPDPKSGWQQFEVPGFREDSIVPQAFTENQRGIQFTGVREGESLDALYQLDLESRAVEKLYGHATADIDLLIHTIHGGPVIGVRIYHGKPEYHWLVPDHPKARAYRALEKAFAGQTILITSMTDDRKRAIVRVWSDVNPGEYFLLDLESMRADPMVNARKWIYTGEMRPKTPIELDARDGLRLYGYLTEPEGEGPHPMVVLPHGGPHSVSDTWGYDPEVQLLAHKGYAVLQLNFRGSGGYGLDFEAAGYREWGGKMQDDLADATRWAVDQGHADAGRVCIYGGSFGGYSAMMSVVREPELYRCAVAFAGVYDLELMFSTGDIPRSRLGRDYLERVIGQDRELLRAFSPVHFAERIKAPVLLIHGSEDWRVDVSQARRMKSALERAGKAHEWMEVRGEGHGIFDEALRKEYYERLLAFLETHIGK